MSRYVIVCLVSSVCRLLIIIAHHVMPTHSARSIRTTVHDDTYAWLIQTTEHDVCVCVVSVCLIIIIAHDVMPITDSAVEHITAIHMHLDLPDEL